MVAKSVDEYLDLCSKDPTSAKQYANAMQRSLVEVGFWKSCINCQHYTGSRCLKWSSSPPPDVIVYSCVTGWELKVPF